MQPPEDKWLAVVRPLQPPAIDPRFEELNTLARSTECLRYFILSIEFWISPGGLLRHWLKINLFLGGWHLIPAIVLMPVISLVLHEVDGWLSMLLSILLKLIVLGVLVTVVVLTIKHFPSSSLSSSRRRK